MCVGVCVPKIQPANGWTYYMRQAMKSFAASTVLFAFLFLPQSLVGNV